MNGLLLIVTWRQTNSQRNGTGYERQTRQDDATDVQLGDFSSSTDDVNWELRWWSNRKSRWWLFDAELGLTFGEQLNSLSDLIMALTSLLRWWVRMREVEGGKGTNVSRIKWLLLGEQHSAFFSAVRTVCMRWWLPSMSRFQGGVWCRPGPPSARPRTHSSSVLIADRWFDVIVSGKETRNRIHSTPGETTLRPSVPVFMFSPGSFAQPHVQTSVWLSVLLSHISPSIPLS